MAIDVEVEPDGERSITMVFTGATRSATITEPSRKFQPTLRLSSGGLTILQTIREMDVAILMARAWVEGEYTHG